MTFQMPLKEAESGRAEIKKEKQKTDMQDSMTEDSKYIPQAIPLASS